jgi:hypothetical protein
MGITRNLSQNIKKVVDGWDAHPSAKIFLCVLK